MAPTRPARTTFPSVSGLSAPRAMPGCPACSVCVCFRAPVFQHTLTAVSGAPACPIVPAALGWPASRCLQESSHPPHRTPAQPGHWLQTRQPGNHSGRWQQEAAEVLGTEEQGWGLPEWAAPVSLGLWLLTQSLTPPTLWRGGCPPHRATDSNCLMTVYLYAYL